MERGIIYRYECVMDACRTPFVITYRWTNASGASSVRSLTPAKAATGPSTQTSRRSWTVTFSASGRRRAWLEAARQRRRFVDGRRLMKDSGRARRQWYRPPLPITPRASIDSWTIWATTVTLWRMCSTWVGRRSSVEVSVAQLTPTTTPSPTPSCGSSASTLPPAVPDQQPTTTPNSTSWSAHAQTPTPACWTISEISVSTWPTATRSIWRSTASGCVRRTGGRPSATASTPRQCPRRATRRHSDRTLTLHLPVQWPTTNKSSNSSRIRGLRTAVLWRCRL